MQRRNKVRSWAFGFHVLFLVWLCFRQAFWALSTFTDVSWSPSTFYFVYWLPHPIQFAMYLLVPLFYVKVLSKLGRWHQWHQWHEWLGAGETLQVRWTCLRNSYGGFVLAMMTFMVGWVVAARDLEQAQMRCFSTSKSWLEADDLSR